MLTGSGQVVRNDGDIARRSKCGIYRGAERDHRRGGRGGKEDWRAGCIESIERRRWTCKVEVNQSALLGHLYFDYHTAVISSFKQHTTVRKAENCP